MDFTPGMNTATMKHYIDFSADAKLEFMLIDGGWSDRRDITKPSPAIDMPEIIRYAKSKNVGVWVWPHWTAVDRQMDEAFPLFEAVLGLEFLGEGQFTAEVYADAPDRCEPQHPSACEAGFRRRTRHAHLPGAVKVSRTRPEGNPAESCVILTHRGNSQEGFPMMRALTAVLAVWIAAGAPAATDHRPAVVLTRVPNGGIQPQAAAEPNGAVHMIYFSGDPKGGDLFYIRSTAQSEKFSRPMRVNSQEGSVIALGTIRGGQIAVDGNGRVHVAWNGSNTALPRGPVNPEAGTPGSPMLYTRLNDRGTAFEPQRNVMLHSFGLDGGGTVAADAAGNVYVAWHGKGIGAAEGEAGRQVWVAESHDAGKTFAAEVPAWNQSTGACGCCGMTLFAAREGTLFALYRSATQNVHRDIYLLASKNQGKSFQGSKVDSWEINACPMSSMSFAENAGNTYAAWETGGQVLFGKVSGEAVPKLIAAPGAAKGRKHPRLAVNSRGETLLVWTEGTGWQRGGSIAWQVFDRNGDRIGDKGSAPGLPTWSFGAAATRADGTFTIFY